MLDRSVTRFASANRAPSLRRAECNPYHPNQHRNMIRQALSLPDHGRCFGVNRLRRLNITGTSAKLRQSLAGALGGAIWPYGFAEGRLCLAPLILCRAANAVRRANGKHVRSWLRHHRMALIRRLAPHKWCWNPRPPLAGQLKRGRAACGVTPCPLCLPVQPVRPRRKRGLP
jgi:hypothetical protein